jgi:hypothetical protein
MIHWDSVLKRMETLTLKTESCWLFQGSLSHGGYGEINIDGEVKHVHRVSAHLFLGLDINNSKQWALHRRECKSTSCWNPEHLYVGTASDNRTDQNRPHVTHCKHGHEYIKSNTGYTTAGARYCKICLRMRDGNKRRNARDLKR